MASWWQLWDVPLPSFSIVGRWNASARSASSAGRTSPGRAAGGLVCCLDRLTPIPGVGNARKGTSSITIGVAHQSNDHKEVPDVKHGRWVGSASTPDHFRDRANRQRIDGWRNSVAVLTSMSLMGPWDLERRSTPSGLLLVPTAGGSDGPDHRGRDHRSVSGPTTRPGANPGGLPAVTSCLTRCGRPSRSSDAVATIVCQCGSTRRMWWQPKIDSCLGPRRETE